MKCPPALLLVSAVVTACWAAAVVAGPGSPEHANPRRADETTGQALLRSAIVSLGQSFEERRHAMVSALRSDVLAADPAVDDAGFEAVLSVMDSIPRELFVEPHARAAAYLPTPVLIGYEQTISDPYIVALMTSALALPPRANVLDVGTGSGYQAAVLSRLAKQVTSIEIVRPLASDAAKRLRSLGFGNVSVHAGDGFRGWPSRAPFDGIVVAAGAAKVPQPLIDQLKIGGRLVMPIGPSAPQEQLVVVTRLADGKTTRCSLGLASFVPLTGKGERATQASDPLETGIALCHRASLT